MKRAVLFLVTVSVFGCVQTPKEPSSLRMAFPYEIVTMDPHGHTDSVTRAVLSSVYEGLVAFVPGRPVQPWLADRWDNPDHTTWRLHIRDGVLFHDGRELTAEDVAASIVRAGESAIGDIEQIRIDEDDEGMIVITTSRPSPLLLTHLEAVAIVPVDFNPARPVGTGPYRWELGPPSGPIVLRSWKRYWNNPPDFDEINIQFVTASEDLVRLVDGDNIDVVTSVSVSHVRKNPLRNGWQLSASPAVTTTYLALNVGREPLGDARVRQAIDLAIDRPDLVAKVFPEGTAQSARSVIPPEIFGFSPDLMHRGSDLERARALIKESRVPEGTVIELVFHAAYAEPAEVLVQRLASIGLNIRATLVSYDDFYRSLGKAANDLSVFSWTFRVADSSPFLETIVHSRDPIRGMGLFNGAMLADPHLDRLIEEAAHEPQFVLRLELLQEALRALDDHRVYLPLFQPSNLALARDEYVLESSSCSVTRPQDVRLRH